LSGLFLASSEALHSAGVQGAQYLPTCNLKSNTLNPIVAAATQMLMVTLLQDCLFILFV
jgi:hypothetical protein